MQSYITSGLSDPKKGISGVREFLEKPHDLRKDLGVFQPNANQDIDNILGEDSCYHHPNDIFDPRVATLSTYNRDRKLLGFCGMKEKGVNGLGVSNFLEYKIYGYTFAHGFIGAKCNTNTEINTAWFDFSAIQKTIDIIGISEFHKLDQEIGKLFFYMNHDYTLHQLGLNTKNKKTNTVHPIDTILLSHINMAELSNGIKPDTTEICAAIFHKDILTELNESGYPIYNDIKSAIEKIAEQINKIDDIKVKRYWNSILKYIAFSTIPADDIFFQKLKSIYPDIDLVANRWGQAIHSESIPLKIGKQIGIRELRVAVINDLNNIIPHGYHIKRLLK